MISKNPNLNKTKTDKSEMKIKSHKSDYLKMELKYLDVKVADLLLSDIFRTCAGGWGQEWFSGWRILCPLMSRFFPLFVKNHHECSSQWKTWELVFLVLPPVIYICAEQLLKATKAPFVLLANNGFLKAPEKWMATRDWRNGGLNPLYNEALTTENQLATKKIINTAYLEK